jgi:hypothetical protein
MKLVLLLIKLCLTVYKYSVPIDYILSILNPNPLYLTWLQFIERPTQHTTGVLIIVVFVIALAQRFSNF